MADARNVDGPQQEFQLETRHLVLLIALVLVLCVASFMLGRWVERQSLGPAIAGSATGGKSGDAEVADMGDVSKDLTFFDTLEGNKPAPLDPPAASRRSTTPVKPRTASTARTGTGAGADTASQPTANPRRSVNEGVMIQVFASKDRAAADAIRRRLRSKGYTALLVPDRGTYKVRVGPYADREEATRAADVLREQEKLTTWIP